MDKSPDAFRTISEVAEFLETPAHVLRFWESRFPQIKPVKRAGGRRYYRPADLALLVGIRKLLHDEGMTIRGVQKILREQGVRHVSGLAGDDNFDDSDLDIAPEEAELEPVVSSAPIQLFPKGPAPIVPPQEMPTPEVFAPPQTLDEADTADADAPAETIEFPDADTTEMSTAVADDEDAPKSQDPQVPDSEDTLDEEALIAALGSDVNGAATDETTAPSQASVIAAPVKGSQASRPDNAHNDLFGDDSQSLASSSSEKSSSDSGDGVSATPEINLFTAMGNEADAESIDDTALITDTPAPEDAVADATSPTDPLVAETSDKMAEPAPEVAAEIEGEPLPEVAAKPASVAAKAVDDTPPTSADEPKANIRPLPGPLPPAMDITGQWFAADLRSLRAGAFGDHAPQAVALFERLKVLRNRVGDLGRVPRR